MGLINFSSITQDDRQRIIIEFIRSKPYCNVEDVVRGVKNDISRVTVFKILHKLIESGAVRRHLENNQKRNSREHKLFVDEGNPLVSVRLELEKFESAYFDLLNKVMIEYQPERIRASLKLTDDEASKMPIMLQGMKSSQLLDIFLLHGRCILISLLVNMVTENI
jgi:hypothetical protein